MKIALLIGANEVEKRNYYLKIKAQFDKDQVTQIDLKQDSIGRLQDIVSAQSLFDVGKRLVVVENTPDTFDLKELAKGDESTNLLLIAGSPKATSTLLKTAKEIKVHLYEFSKQQEITAFPFLDALMEGKKTAFVELEKLLEEYGGMYVLSMIFYGLRRNILPLPKSSFAANKIQAQKQRFGQDDWQKLYKLCLDKEYAFKSGNSDERAMLLDITQKFVSWKPN